MAPPISHCPESVRDCCWVIPIIAASVAFLASIAECSRGYLYVLYMDKYTVDHEAASWPDGAMSAAEHLSGLVLMLLQNTLSVYCMTLLSVATCSLGLLAAAFCSSIAWMTVTIGGLYGLGFGATMICFSVYALMYFDKYRATAASAKFTAWAVSGLASPSILSFLVGFYGLQGALLICGALVIQTLPLIMLVQHPRPLILCSAERNNKMNKPCSTSTVKHPARYDHRAPSVPSLVLPKTQSPRIPGGVSSVDLSIRNIAELFGTVDFYVLITVSITEGWVNSIHSTTAADYALDKGASLEKAKFVLTAKAFGLLLGRSMLPMAVDRIPFSRCPIAVASLAAAFLFFVGASFTESFECFFVLNALAGFCQGYVSCIKTVLIAQYLGVHRMPVLYGITGVFLLPLSFSGPTIVGFFRDTLGSYDNFYRLLGALELLGALTLSLLVFRDVARRSAWHVNRATARTATVRASSI